MKYSHIPLYLILLIASFFGAVFVRDYLYEEWLKSNITRIHVGMTDQEVINILGKPTTMHMSDEPGEIWCYGSDSFSDNPEYCGKGGFVYRFERARRTG